MSTNEPAQEPVEAPEVAGDALEPATFAEDAQTFTTSVENMLTALLHSPKHDVLIHLAREYAVALDLAVTAGNEDAIDALAKLGPKLESVCVRLGVRPAKISGGEHGAGVSPLDAWRARRA